LLNPGKLHLVPTRAAAALKFEVGSMVVSVQHRLPVQSDSTVLSGGTPIESESCYGEFAAVVQTSRRARLQDLDDGAHDGLQLARASGRVPDGTT
jgi:hypothetical protein